MTNITASKRFIMLFIIIVISQMIKFKIDVVIVIAVQTTRGGRSVPLGESSRLHLGERGAWIVTARRRRAPAHWTDDAIDVVEKHFDFIETTNLNFNLIRSHNITTDNR